MMSERDLAGRRRAAAPHEARFADGVVRRAKRSLQEQRLAVREEPHGAVNLRGLDAFGRAEVGQNRRQSLREERLSGARAADHQNMMTARRSDGDGPLGHFLPFDVGIVGVIPGEFRGDLAPTERDGFNFELARIKADRLGQRADGNNFDAIHNGGFLGIGSRHEQPLLALFAGGDRHGQRALDVADCAFQGQFSHGGVAVEPVGLQLAAGGKQPDGDRQVERRGFFGKLGGGQVDDDAIDGAMVAAVDQGPFDAVDALFDSPFRQPDDDCLGQCAG